MGEGGGQLLRYSVALSALTGEPIRVFNIRAKRSNPGLRPQHMTAIRLISKMVNAEVKGLRVGSMSIEFIPKTKVKGGRYEIDVGTAGSVSLVLQATLPVAIFADSPLKIRLIGGTSVRWSPPVPYLQNILIPLISKFGPTIKIKLIKRGFYPRGKGIVEVEINPVEELIANNFTPWSKLISIEGISYCSNLPPHVAIRQRNAAMSLLRSYGYSVSNIEIDYQTPALDKGSGIVLWAKTDTGILGSDALGERGKPAEKVGQEAAIKLVDELKTRMGIDRHALDNLLIYASLAKGLSVLTSSELTSHAATVIELCKIILNAKFTVNKLKNGIEVKCHGVGFSTK